MNFKLYKLTAGGSGRISGFATNQKDILKCEAEVNTEGILKSTSNL